MRATAEPERSLPGAGSVRVSFQPSGAGFDVPAGETLFDAAARAGVDVDTVCGGNGSCGKCKVRIDEGAPPVKSIDSYHLTAVDIAAGYRLSCQLVAERDLVVHVPSSGGRTKVRILHEGVRREVPLQPNVHKTYIPYVPPRHRDGIADWDSVKSGLPRAFHGVRIPLPWLRRLPELIRDEQGMTIVVANRGVIRLEPGDTTAHNYGVALDIGSTTVVGFLIDLNTGEQLAVASLVNHQSSYGDDLVARLSRAQHNPDGLALLHELIVADVDEICGQLARDAAVEPAQINEVVVVGNMTMHHFLLRLDSTYLGLSPYAPVVRDSVVVQAGELGLRLDPEVPVYVLPNIAGFVGSDTVAMVLAAQLHLLPELRMAVDVGTNGEIVLGSRTRLIACSAPAGPAFEGARITQGMRAVPGAIEHVELSGDITCSVIGGIPPRGVCGSALIDIAAVLLDAGVVDRSGKLLRGDELPASVPGRIRERILEGESRKDSAFVLAWAEETGAERDVVFTQQDLREFQLAKGAIRAGGMVLQQVLGVVDGDLEEVLLAGGFGTTIDLANARRANLVPRVPLDRLRSLGNAAGVGARLALTSTRERVGAERIGRRTEHVRLSGMDDFQKAFVSAMQFPDL